MNMEVTVLVVNGLVYCNETILRQIAELAIIALNVVTQHKRNIKVVNSKNPNSD